MSEDPVDTPPNPSVSILLLAKLPVPGGVKTRLAKDVGNERAAALAGAFLADTLSRLQLGGIGPIWLLGDRASAEPFAPFLNDHVTYCDQGDGDLGARLRRGFERAFHAGFDGAIVLGADTPHIPIPVVEKARNMVARGDIALGPSSDGGYYLLGIPRHASGFESIFDDVDWGTSKVLARTRVALGAAGLAWHELERFWDIDRWGDLVQWAEDIALNGIPSPPPTRSLRCLRDLLETKPQRGGGNPLQSGSSPVDERSVS